MPNRPNLDLDTLRTLSIVTDLGGLAQAAARLNRTPSAISLQLKRLQDDLGVVIFRKRGRRLVLTEAGETTLAYARRILALHDELLETTQGAKLAGQIRVGCPQDFAPILPTVLSRFASLYPRMQLELRVDGNGALADAIEDAQLDLAVVIGHENRPGARTVGQLTLAWIASSAWAPVEDQPIPLAMLGPQCDFRKRAVHLLTEARIPFRTAASSHSLEGLWAALLGGLGITLRTALTQREGLVAAPGLHGLPIAGTLPVTLHRRAHCDGVAMDRMAALLIDALGLVLVSGPGSAALRDRSGDEGTRGKRRSPKS